MTTKLIRSLFNIGKSQQHSVLTIGNFDGVHLGHQYLITEVIKVARSQKLAAMVMTFEPQAFEYFAKENVKVPRLTRLREKFCAFMQLGVDYVLIQSFNQAFANLSALDFVGQVLHDRLKVNHVIVGDDFRFGHQRQGDFGLLQKFGKEWGFQVSAIPSFTVGGARVSSTRIREALALGKHDLVKTLLGHPYTMLGRVRHGDKLGRQWGFPTANIFLHRKLTPVHGVYTVLMRGITACPILGVANVGSRPTVDGTRTLLEVHLLDFNQDIYGQQVEIEFCAKLRDEEHYPTIALLKQQIAKDVNDARNYFSKTRFL